MDTTLRGDQNQTKISQKLVVSDKFGVFAYYFSKLKLGTILNKSGITKTKGASPLELFTIVFNLAFIGKNLFEGVVRNKKIQVGKDAVYNFLNSSTYNWRRFLLLVSNRIYIIISHFLDDSSEEVLIFDDSTYDRSRSKTVELLSRVFDHTTGRYLKGFRMLTLGWSDGNTFSGVDFALLLGVIAFLLNYIPSIGSVIAAIQAILVALVGLDINAVFWVILLYLVINVAMGNIIEPKYMGKGL